MTEEPPKDSETWARAAVDAFEIGYREREDQHPCTLAAYRTDNSITQTFGDWVRALDAQGKDGFRWLRDAVSVSQSFAYRDTFDMKDLALSLKREAKTQSGKNVSDACDDLIDALDKARIASTALGERVRQATGLAVWVPTSRYSFLDVEETYSKLRFDQSVQWTQYLRKNLFP
jgi:hypothetical protein